MCVSVGKVSPLTAMLKCPHYEKGNIGHETEGEAEVSRIEDGIGWSDHAEGDWQAMGVEWFDKEGLIRSSQYYKVLTH